MKVTAVITTYKRPISIVDRAINSVINQTFSGIELILVDDSPMEYAVENGIIDYYKRRDDIIYIKHESNKGACAARNTGLRASTCDYIAFLDDDDEWLPNKIEKEYEGFLEDDKIGLVYCSAVINNESNGTDTIRNFKCYQGSVFNKLLVENFVGSTSFPLIKKSLLVQIGGFDENLESSQDYDVWLRLSKITQFKYINIPLVRYYFHEGEQITRNPQKRINGINRVYEKNKEFYDKNKMALYEYYRNLAPNYALMGNSRFAIKLYYKMIKIKPFAFKSNYDCISHVLVYHIRNRRRNWTRHERNKERNIM